MVFDRSISRFDSSGMSLGRLSASNTNLGSVDFGNIKLAATGARHFFDGGTSTTQEPEAAYFSSRCSQSNDCAVGWRCVDGECQPPQNLPGKTSDDEGVDAGCGSGGYVSGGGCGSSFAGGCSSPGPGGSGCGGDDNPDPCCGGEKCYRTDSSGGLSFTCGPCPEDSGNGSNNPTCNKFCADSFAATGNLGAGCSANVVCDECSTCQLQSAATPDSLAAYGCVPSSGGPCHCDPAGTCDSGAYCNADTGTCDEVEDNPEATPGGQTPGYSRPISKSPDDPVNDPDPSGDPPEKPEGDNDCVSADCPSCFTCDYQNGGCKLIQTCKNFYFWKIVTFTYEKRTGGYLGCSGLNECSQSCDVLRSTIVSFGGLAKGAAYATPGGDGLTEGPEPDDPSWSFGEGTTKETSALCSSGCKAEPCLPESSYTYYNTVRPNGEPAIGSGNYGRGAFTGEYTQNTPYSCTTVTFKGIGYQEYEGYGESSGEAYADAANQAYAPYNQTC